MSDTEGRRFQGGVDTDGPDWRPLRAADMGRVQAISELLHPAL